jgi:Zn-dependent protease with chaperone function
MVQLVWIPLLFEWVMLVTLVTTFGLANNRYFYQRPSIGIALWFGGFISAGSAVVISLVISLLVALASWQQPRQLTTWQQVVGALAISMAPWLLLALGGISVALVSLKLESNLALDGQEPRNPKILGVPTFHHRSIPVFKIDLGVPLALAVGKNLKDGQIVISSAALTQLTDSELRAVLEHEYFHLRRNHSFASRITKLVRQLTFRIMASRLLQTEVDLLLELAADKFAAKSTSSTIMSDALTKMHAGVSSRELRIRLSQLS